MNKHALKPSGVLQWLVLGGLYAGFCGAEADRPTPMRLQNTRDTQRLPVKLRDTPGQHGPYFHQVFSASSADGLTWTQDNRLLLDHASVPAAIMTPQGRIRLYYVDASNAIEGQPEQVNVAESEDSGKTFYVLGCTIENRDSEKSLDPSIVLLPDGCYRLYYYAAHGSPNTTEPHTVRSAVSKDGIHFVAEQVVFTYPGLVDPDVFWSGREWIMFCFSLADNQLVLARSPDGLTFKFDRHLSLDGWIPVTPIKLDDGRLRAYAFDQKTQTTVTSFVSSDGIHWKREEGVRLNAPEGKKLTDPFVVRLPDGQWKMFFKLEILPPVKRMKEKGLER